jgi:hypothetical protein
VLRIRAAKTHTQAPSVHTTQLQTRPAVHNNDPRQSSSHRVRLLCQARGTALLPGSELHCSLLSARSGVVVQAFLLPMFPGSCCVLHLVYCCGSGRRGTTCHDPTTKVWCTQAQQHACLHLQTPPCLERAPGKGLPHRTCTVSCCCPTGGSDRDDLVHTALKHHPFCRCDHNRHHHHRQQPHALTVSSVIRTWLWLVHAMHVGPEHCPLPKQQQLDQGHNSAAHCSGQTALHFSTNCITPAAKRVCHPQRACCQLDHSTTVVFQGPSSIPQLQPLPSAAAHSTCIRKLLLSCSPAAVEIQ